MLFDCLLADIEPVSHLSLWQSFDTSQNQRFSTQLGKLVQSGHNSLEFLLEFNSVLRIYVRCRNLEHFKVAARGNGDDPRMANMIYYNPSCRKQCVLPGVSNCV